MHLRTSRRIGYVAAGVVLGALLLSPVAAHVGDEIGHLWGDHIKQKADARYVKGSDVMWARVAASGALKSDRGVRSSEELDIAAYLVVFQRAVRNCSLSATAQAPDIFASALPVDGEPNEVQIELRTSGGSFPSSAFTLLAVC